jgi:hypothetical protein
VLVHGSIVPGWRTWHVQRPLAATNRNAERRIVQTKRWTSWLVGVDEVRAFAGTLLAEGLPGKSGIFVTFGGFTTGGVEEVAGTGVTVVDGPALHARVEKARRLEPCPTFGAPMLLDRSSRGWWFRCVAAGCSGKRDPGRDPARAVELLTQMS